MKYSAVCIVVLLCPLLCLALEYNVGVTVNAGLGLSRWSGDFYNGQGIWITNHLDSKEPVYQGGLGLKVWFTDALGAHAGLQYGRYDYYYTCNAPPEITGARYEYGNLLMPLEFMYGFLLGGKRLTIGGGVMVCRQLNGKIPGPVLFSSIPDSLLTTTVGPQISLGYEIKSGRLRIFPSLRYVYGIDGLNENLLSATESMAKHYVLFGVGVFYRL
jgi:hypothetical protein